MKKMKGLTDEQFLLGGILIMANIMDTMMERELAEFDLTTKQWFLSMILGNLFDSPPTIKEAAKEMGSSHQNVKQVALKLEKKGLLSLEKDEKDGRAIRMRLTEKSEELAISVKAKVAKFSEKLFEGIEKDKLSAGRELVTKLGENMARLNTSK